MKTWVLGLLNLAFFSGAASAAFQHASLNQLVQQTEQACEQFSASNGLSDFIQYIAADGTQATVEDPRKSGAVGAAAAGMTVDEYKRATETTGYVSCPGTNGNGSMGSATLVEPGNQVLTNAHIFIDKTGMYREPLSECFFQSQATPPQRRSLNFSAKDLYKLFTSYPIGDAERDLALVRIIETDQPITKYKPFPVKKSGRTIGKNETITMVSATQRDLIDNPKFPRTSPIFQSCKYQGNTRSDGPQRTDGIFSDCVAANGSSGSIQMVRNEAGQLEIAGVTAFSGKKNPACQYDLKTGCYTFATEITPGVLKEIRDFQIANANTRSNAREANNRSP